LLHLLHVVQGLESNGKLLENADEYSHKGGVNTDAGCDTVLHVATSSAVSLPVVLSVTAAITATVVAVMTVLFASVTVAHTALALMASTAAVSMAFMVVISAFMTSFVEMASAMTSIDGSLLNVVEINRLLFLLLGLWRFHLLLSSQWLSHSLSAALSAALVRLVPVFLPVLLPLLLPIFVVIFVPIVPFLRPVVPFGGPLGLGLPLLHVIFIVFLELWLPFVALLSLFPLVLIHTLVDGLQLGVRKLQ